MRVCRFWLLFILFSISTLCHSATDPAWTTTITPFQIAENLYYVGSQDLASYLVVTPKGNILINANLDTSPPQIRASVEKLGFRWKDTRILLNSQAHFDHRAGAADVIRETHAKNMVMDGDVSVAETGGRTDFLAPSPNIHTYRPVHVDRILHDEDTVAWVVRRLPPIKRPATHAGVPHGPCALISRVKRRGRCATSSLWAESASGRNTILS